MTVDEVINWNPMKDNLPTLEYIRIDLKQVSGHCQRFRPIINAPLPSPTVAPQGVELLITRRKVGVNAFPNQIFKLAEDPAEE